MVAFASFLLGLGLIVFLWSPNWQLAARVGAWPATRTPPRTLTEIRALLQQSPPPMVVAEGWSFFISMTPPEVPYITLRENWSGVVRWEGPDVVVLRSGTLMGEMVKALWQRGRAPLDRPQFDQLSVGGALRTCAHGWHGHGWFIDSVLAITCIKRGSGEIAEAHRSSPKFWTMALGSEWVILEVQMMTVPNRLVRIQQQVEEGEASCLAQPGEAAAREGENSWREAAFRLMFVSSKHVIRKWGTYVPEGVGQVDVDEANVTGRTLRWRSVRRFVKCPAQYDIVDSVADAHTLIRTVWPLERIITHIANIVNFELFAVVAADWMACRHAMFAFHKRYGGRTDLRERSVHGISVTAFDVIIPAYLSNGIAAWFDLLHQVFGVRKGSLHTGKYLPSDGGPIELLSPHEFWATAAPRPYVSKS